MSTHTKIQVRQSPSGKRLEGDVGEVATAVDDGTKTEFQTVSEGGITALTGALVADKSGSGSGTVDGSWSGAQAFNGDNALTNLITALANSTQGGGGFIAPGTYTEDLDVSGLTLKLTGLGAPNVDVSSDPVAVLAGALTLGGEEPASDITLENLHLEQTVDGNGELSYYRVSHSIGSINGDINLTSRDSSFNVSLGNTAALATLDDVNSQFFQAVHVGGTTTLLNSTFADQLFVEGVATTTNLTLLNSGATQIFTGDTTHTNMKCNGVYEGGNAQHEFFGCLFNAALNGTGIFRFFSTLSFGNGFPISNTEVHMDATSERTALAGGADISVKIFALSLGQGGDALVFNNNATVNFTAETRRYIPQGVSGKTLTINPTGGDGSKFFFVDNWGGANTVNGVALAAESAGSGTRYIFQSDSGATAVSYVGSQKL